VGSRVPVGHFVAWFMIAGVLWFVIGIAACTMYDLLKESEDAHIEVRP
jgi:hypothetical protein